MYRVMHKLAKIFIDPGPRAVAERFRNKIDKFKVLCRLEAVVVCGGSLWDVLPLIT